MIPTTKQRLTVLFTLGISLFCGAIFSISYFYLHASILGGIQEQLKTEGQEEFVALFRSTDLEGFAKMKEDEIFQLFSRQGKLIVQSANSAYFHYPANPIQLAQLSGKAHFFEQVEFDHVRYLLMYFVLSPNQVGRIAIPIVQLIRYEHNFVQMLVWSIPGILLFAYILSRLAVFPVMRPITEAFRFQENFSSNVTHELHSPLTSLKGNLEVSLRKERSPAQYKEFIQVGLNEVDRIIHLLRDLYLLASSNYKTLTLEQEEVLLCDLVDELELSLKTKMEGKGLQLERDWPQDLSLICDSNLFNRALANLLDNGVKYSVEGSQIKLKAHTKNHKFYLSCVNQSQYLKNETTRSLLTPFYRGSNCSSFNAEGKGLGLSIISYIALSHKGKLDIEISESGMFKADLTLRQP